MVFFAFHSWMLALNTTLQNKHFAFSIATNSIQIWSHIFAPQIFFFADSLSSAYWHITSLPLRDFYALWLYGLSPMLFKGLRKKNLRRNYFLTFYLKFKKGAVRVVLLFTHEYQLRNPYRINTVHFLSQQILFNYETILCTSNIFLWGLVDLSRLIYYLPSLIG